MYKEIAEHEISQQNFKKYTQCYFMSATMKD